MITLSETSERRLRGVHPDLTAVVRRAAQLTDQQFLVVEGVRSVKRQKKLVARGASTTMRSRHLTGHAVDLVATVDGWMIWDKPESGRLAIAMKAAATELGVELDWGGDWTSFVDTPHFQLDWAAYPKQVGAPPPATPVATAIKESKTIFGAALAALGTMLQTFSDAIARASEFAADAIAAMLGLEPIGQLASALGANLPALGFGAAATGVVIVISRRLNAAKLGKIG